MRFKKLVGLYIFRVCKGKFYKQIFFSNLIMADDKTQKIKNIMKQPEFIRNVGVCAHIDRPLS